MTGVITPRLIKKSAHNVGGSARLPRLILTPAQLRAYFRDATPPRNINVGISESESGKLEQRLFFYFIVVQLAHTTDRSSNLNDTFSPGRIAL